MTTLRPSFTVPPSSLNYEAGKLVKLKAGICGVKQIGNLVSSQVSREGSWGITKWGQREMQSKVFASPRGSDYQIEIQPDIVELENASTYLFRTDRGGQVKVYVGRKNTNFIVMVEVSFLPHLIDENKLVLSWGVYRSDSSSLLSLKPKGSSTRYGISQTPFSRNALGRHSVQMEFDSSHAPFYLSFRLQCQSSAEPGIIEMRSHRHTNFCIPVGIGSGCPSPLGISFPSDGSVNFALFSRNAESVVLCLFDEMEGKPSLEIDLDPYINRTGDIWHVSLDSVSPYTCYGYRCRGTIPREKGKAFLGSPVLLDPYAKVLQNCIIKSPGSVSLVRYLGKLAEEPSFDWSGEVFPRLPMEKLVVYRLNVDRFTKNKSSKLKTDVRGTFTGLIEKIHHFKSLGVNAILLEPIFTFNEKKGPYFPCHFFAPMSSCESTRDSLSATGAMKEMIKVMHANNIEVLLEVVFTYTAECVASAAQATGFQGIDNESYYIFNEDVDSKVKTSLNCNHPVVQRMILDSLRHWVKNFHIDGFCFMNATSLLRGPNHEFLSRPPLIEAIAFDPLLSKTKFIADSLDPYNLASKEMQFPHWKRWAEMNAKFCSDVRNFLRGEGPISNLATRLCGSADIFLHGRGPAFSFNFIARNFGLPLVDMVSFTSSELASEISWNCGEEGPTNKTVVLERRLKQIRNSLFILYVSLGVPVLNMGDECGQSSGGSQSYNHRKSFNWDALNTSFGVQITQFVAFLSSLRIRRGDFLQRRNYIRVENVDWHGSDQALPRWGDPSSKFLAMTLKADVDCSESNSKESRSGGDLFIAFNASDCSETVILPPPSQGMAWFRLVDTALPFPGFFLADGEPVIEQTSGLLSYEMKSHSCTLFEALSVLD